MSDEINSSSPNNSKLYAGLAIGLIAVVLVAARQFNQTENGSETTPTNQVMETGQQAAEGDRALEMVTLASYQDGVYDVIGEYMSPGGAEQIAVKVALQDGVITEASVETQAVRPNSVKFQNIFAENYQEQVIGKSIDQLKLDKVAGSSLTPKGFNDALEKIKAQAQTS